MRSTIAATTLIVLMAAAAPAAAEVTAVQIDQFARVTLQGSAATVMTGNPSIADVQVVNRNTIMIVGKSYGLTNVIALDSSGRTILNRQVQVSPGAAGRMTLYRGASPYNYACSPVCERTPMPGETNESFNNAEPPYTDYLKRQSTGGAAPPPPQ